MKASELLDKYVSTIEEYAARLEATPLEVQDGQAYSTIETPSDRFLALESWFQPYKVIDNADEEIAATEETWHLECRDTHFQTAVYSKGGRYRIIPHKMPHDLYDIPADAEFSATHHEAIDRQLLAGIESKRRELLAMPKDKFRDLCVLFLKILTPIRERALLQAMEHYANHAVHEIRREYPNYQLSAAVKNRIDEIISTELSEAE